MHFPMSSPLRFAGDPLALRIHIQVAKFRIEHEEPVADGIERFNDPFLRRQFAFQRVALAGSAHCCGHGRRVRADGAG